LLLNNNLLIVEKTANFSSAEKSILSEPTLVSALQVPHLSMVVLSDFFDRESILIVPDNAAGIPRRMSKTVRNHEQLFHRATSMNLMSSSESVNETSHSPNLEQLRRLLSLPVMSSNRSSVGHNSSNKRWQAVRSKPYSIGSNPFLKSIPRMQSQTNPGQNQGIYAVSNCKLPSRTVSPVKNRKIVSQIFIQNEISCGEIAKAALILPGCECGVGEGETNSTASIVNEALETVP